MTKACRCIAVNNSYRIAPWAEIVWFGDVKWWDWHHEELIATGMKIATCCEHGGAREWEKSGRVVFYSRDRSPRYGISEKCGFVAWNGSSGAGAINLAYHMGAKKIILLGFDMHRISGKKNWHMDHRESTKYLPFTRHLKAFPNIKKDADRLGLTILNATPGSMIKQFPIVSLEEALRG